MGINKYRDNTCFILASPIQITYASPDDRCLCWRRTWRERHILRKRRFRDWFRPSIMSQLARKITGRFSIDFATRRTYGSNLCVKTNRDNHFWRWISRLICHHHGLGILDQFDYVVHRQLCKWLENIVGKRRRQARFIRDTGFNIARFVDSKMDCFD